MKLLGHTFMLLLVLSILVHPADPQDQEKLLNDLVASLDSENPGERDRGQAALIELGVRVLPRLRAALPSGTPEQKGRLAAIIREIEFRVEESAVREEGLPSRPVRLVPAFRERLSSADEQRVLEVVREIFGYRKGREDGDERWSFEDAKIKTPEEARGVLQYVLARSQGSALKLVALNLVERWRPRGMGQAIAKLVSDPDSSVRMAVLTLGRDHPLAGAEEALGQRLKEGNVEEKEAALRAIGEMRSSRAKELAISSLSDESPDVRRAAIPIFQFEEAPSSAIPALRRLLKDPNADIRSQAIFALMNQRAFDAAEDILALKDDPSPKVRCDALATFGHWRDVRGMQAVLEFLGKPEDTAVHRHALLVAAEIGGSESLPKLFEIMKANEGESSDLAARAIASIGPGELEKTLLGMAAVGEPAHRRLAIRALSGKPTKEAITLFLRTLPEPNPALRKEAAQALGHARGPEAIQAQKEALKDASLRKVVLETLAKSDDASMAPLVVPMLVDPDSDVVLKALDVIESKCLRDTATDVEQLLTHASEKIREKAVDTLNRIAGVPAIKRHLDLLDSGTSRIRRRVLNDLGIDPDEEAVEAIVSRFEKLREDDEYWTIQILEKVVSDSSTAFLITLTEKEHGKLQWQAAIALARRRNERGLKLAREYLRGSDQNVRLEAALVLIDIPADSEAAAMALISGISLIDDRQRPRYLAPIARRHRPELKKTLVDRLLCEAWYERDDAAAWMAGYAPGTFDEEIRRLAQEKSDVARQGAARALHYVRFPDRAELLFKLLKDEALSVRDEALGACKETPLDHAPPGLGSFLSDPSEKTRIWAIEALTALDPGPLKEHMQNLLSDPSPSVRAQALRAVSARRIPVESATLVTFLEDSNHSVQQAAIEAARALNDKACAEKLLKLSKEDVNDYTSSHAAHALMALGYDTGRDAVRARLGHGTPIFEAAAALQLVRERDLQSVPSALRFVAASGSYFHDANRVLLAMNVFTQPALYKRAQTNSIKVEWTRGTKREWLSALSTAYGLRFEVEKGFHPAFLDQPMPEQKPYERSLDEEMTSLGNYLNAACVFEGDHVRVMRRADALAFWDHWYRENNK